MNKLESKFTYSRNQGKNYRKNPVTIDKNKKSYCKVFYGENFKYFIKKIYCCLNTFF